MNTAIGEDKRLKGDEVKLPRNQRKVESSISGPSSTAPALLQPAAQIKYSMIFQLVSRILTFAMNNAIARFSSADYLGIVAVRLDLISVTIGMLARDGIKRAIFRSSEAGGVWLGIPLAIIVGLGCALIAASTVPQIFVQDGAIADYYLALAGFVLAACLETLTDGPALAGLQAGRFADRVTIESSALLIKIGFILTSIRSNPNSGIGGFVRTFAGGQLIYVACLNAFYWQKYWRQAGSFFKRPTPSFIHLAWSLTRENLFKFFLSQGDTLVVGSFASLQDQGVYVVVANYGSLLLRLVMQPIEEASLQFFSQKLALNPMQKTKQAGPIDDCVVQYFSFYLKILTYLALTLTCFGAFFTDPLIRGLLGARWWQEGTATWSLGAYCLLVAAAGISGFLESFVHAVIDEEWMTWSRKATILSTALYCWLAILMIRRFGSTGLIMASAFNFAIRAGCNAKVTNCYWKVYGKTSIWRQSAIPFEVAFMFIAAAVVNATMLALFGQHNWKLRIPIGILLFISVATSASLKDRNFLKSLLNKMK